MDGILKLKYKIITGLCLYEIMNLKDTFMFYPT